MIAVIDVVGKNLASITNALKRLNVDYELTHSEQTIRNASHIILPGVGTANEGMRALQTYGLVELLQNATQPVIGICLGMQLLMDYSEEGDVACLGLIPGKVSLMRPEQKLPVPHMGWNQLHWVKSSDLNQGLKKEDYVYFIHNYALPVCSHTLASCEYGDAFSAIIQCENRLGMQFHPEKSGDVGLRILQNSLVGASSC